MSTTTATRLITAEEYALRPDDGVPTEPVRGEIVEMNQPGPRHGQVCSNISFLLRLHTRTHDSGRVLTNDSGIITERDPDTVRGGDVWYISYDKAPKGPLPSKYLSVPPDIVFEVLSPSNSRGDVQIEVGEYLRAGVPLVCVLDPDNSTVHLYSQEKPDVILTSEQHLTFPDLLPGFSVPVQKLFE